MTKVLLVIAGLVQSDGNGFDATTGASKQLSQALYAQTTSGIAYEMKNVLARKNCSVDIMAADSQKHDLDCYDLIIVGSGIYGMKPHVSALRFIKDNEQVLTKKRVALFAVCGSLCTDSDQHRQKALKLVDRMVCGLDPVSKTVFRGKVNDYGKLLNWFGRAVFKTWPPGDYREWNTIRTWSITILEKV